MTIPLIHIVILTFGMFVIGLYGFMKSRNAIRMLASMEIMLNAANINLVAFSVYKDLEGDLAGQVLAIFIISIAAAEAAIGLAIFLLAFKHAQTADVATFRSLSG
ncbi:MAG: NADH-quinone oxidoreductase subunit NuoK [Candidatus Heimdallarchaeota archaeon]